MKTKAMTLLLALTVVIGSSIGIAYAKGEAKRTKTNNQVSMMNQKVSTGKTSNKQEFNEKMIKLMKEYGYKDLAKALEKGDYKPMDEFMNNMSDEDYKNMIEIMRKSGYENMAKMMESISKEDMIQMHNAMGGAEACHGDNGNYNNMMNLN